MAAALVAGAVSSATGFGFALVLSPALVAALDPHEAVSAVLLVGVMLNVLNLLEGAALEQVRRRPVTLALIAALPGLGVGVALLEYLSKPALQIAVGTLVIAAGLVQARLPASLEGREPSASSACAAGLASGTLATSTGLSGPPLVLWLQAHGFPPHEFRSSLAAAFLGLNLAGAVALLVAGGGDELASLSTLALLVAATLSGWWLGGRVFRRLDPGRFRTLVLALLLATGAASLAAGLLAV